MTTHTNPQIDMAILQGDILEDQYYMTNEFNRSNQLMLRLEEM